MPSGDPPMSTVNPLKENGSHLSSVEYGTFPRIWERIWTLSHRGVASSWIILKFPRHHLQLHSSKSIRINSTVHWMRPSRVVEYIRVLMNTALCIFSFERYTLSWLRPYLPHPRNAKLSRIIPSSDVSWYISACFDKVLVEGSMGFICQFTLQANQLF